MLWAGQEKLSLAVRLGMSSETMLRHGLFWFLLLSC